MRFTKIPLIATLMAVALSLLIVLPGIAQTGDRTDGKLAIGNVSVGVFDNIADAQLGKLGDSGTDDRSGADVYIPVEKLPTPGTPAEIGGVTSNQHSPGDPAYMQTPQVSPQDTLFRNTLYSSNQVSAYNTVLINFRHPQFGETGFTPPTTCVDDATNVANAAATYTATVRNTRSTGSITIQLVRSAATGDYQAFFKVIPENAAPYDPDPAADDDEIAYRQHGGPTWCDDNGERDYVADPVNAPDTVTQVATSTTATGAVDNPVVIPGVSTVGGTKAPEGADPPPAVQEIATIFAKHGDRLTITTSGSTSVVDLVVDGEGPDFTAITPADNAVTRPNRLTFSFEVRDDDSGLRHDGESVISSDGDFEEVNPDGDQNLHTEPLSEDTSGSPVSRNGRSQDIDVNVRANPRGSTTAPGYEEISASGTWRMAGNRAGVAYAFTASGAGRADNDYLYQLTAKDRAGNTTTTDANTDTDASDPFVFRVDDIDPELIEVRTGISWDDDKEIVDRSYVALTFGGGAGISHALGEVDTSNIRVVGNDIVGVIHPNDAPVINRGEALASAPTGAAPTDPGPTPPAVVTDPSTRTPAITAPTGWSSTFVDGTDENPADPNPNRTATDYVACTNEDTTDDPTDTTVCPAWAAWTAYENYVSADRTYDARKEAFDTYTQYMRENPGTDIEKRRFAEPQARVYLELATDLAADAKPDVVVVGGAVYDLAGNTNEAQTVRAMDWIAPSLTVTVTGTVNDRPVANEDGSFTVDVRSDEDMRRRPEVYFVSLTADAVLNADGTPSGEYEKYRIVEATRASSLTQQEDENHWARKYRATNVSADGSGVFGVIVLGEDGEDNAGATAGWDVRAHRNSGPPSMSHGLNLTKMNDGGLLLEIDREFNGEETENLGSVTPRSGGEVDVTESANPFVKLEFASEDGEYNVGTFKDSHDRVNVTEITLNGDDVEANLNRVSATSFSLITRDLAVGDYEVLYTAVDDAGNEYEGEFDFEVQARQPYEISVQPGWNLVSLPATPLEPGIGDVLAGKQYITPVLGYQEGDWITAVQEDDGTWRGRLTEIVGGYGYWVHARTFSTIETMLAEVDPAATLPTVPVTAGWNLLGVLDIFQNDADDPPGTAGGNGDEADNYLSSIPWRVAYTYDTTASLWVKTVPDVDRNVLDANGNPVTRTVENEDGTTSTVNVVEQEILNGNGYWVWSATPSTLVP